MAVALKQHLNDATGGSAVAPALLDWYRRERRILPWRAVPGALADPYAVWLSEVMLQQTTVKAVIPYFERFMSTWPTVAALAAAEPEDVLRAWAGLGYYSRANNLHRCAGTVVREHGGRFPETEDGLAALPGIGPYTAAAVAAIAFGAKATPVDGNVERVVARLFAIEAPLPGAKAIFRARAGELTPDRDAGDFAQAQMDLGATICTPKNPSCMICPLQAMCVGHALGIAGALPHRAVKPARPERYGLAFLALREDGKVLLRKRPARGLLAGMLEVPSTDWGDVRVEPENALKMPPVQTQWWPVGGEVRHTFTHFRLTIDVVRGVVPVDTALTLWADQERCRWVDRADLAGEALPSVMRKVLQHGFKSGD